MFMLTACEHEDMLVACGLHQLPTDLVVNPVYEVHVQLQDVHISLFSSASKH